MARRRAGLHRGGLFVLAEGTGASLRVLGVVLFGFGVGNAISVPPVIANLEFPSREAARVVALIIGISQGSYAIAPALFGLLRQVCSDRIMFLAAATIQLAAIIAYLFGRGASATNKLPGSFRPLRRTHL